MSKPELCAVCGTPMLSVLYYDANGEPVGGHYVCSSCGPRSIVELPPPAADLHHKLLERKAS